MNTEQTVLREGFLSDEQKKSFEKILAEIVLSYDKQRDAKDVKQFCADYMLELKTFEDASAALVTVTDVCDTIDRIDEEYQSLREAEQRGTSRANWLKGILEEFLSAEKGKKRNEIITELQHSVADAATNLFRKTTKQDTQIAAPLPTYSLDHPVDAQIAVDHLVGGLQNVATLTTLVFSDEFEKDAEKTFQEIGAVKNFFSDPLGAARDRNLKKIVSVGAAIAQHAGAFTLPAGTGLTEISAAVDMGLSTVKAAYKVGAGETTPLKAMEYVYDRATAVASTLVKCKSAAIGWAKGTAIGAKIGSVFGSVGTVVGAVAGGVVGKLAGDKVGGYLAQGVKKVAEVAKSAVKTVVEGVKNAAKSFAKSKWNPLNW